MLYSADLTPFLQEDSIASDETAQTTVTTPQVDSTTANVVSDSQSAKQGDTPARIVFVDHSMPDNGKPETSTPASDSTGPGIAVNRDPIDAPIQSTINTDRFESAYITNSGGSTEYSDVESTTPQQPPNVDTDQTPTHQLVVIDRGVANAEELFEDLLASNHPHTTIDVLTIEHSENGLKAITKALYESDHQYDALHIIAHGASAQIQLGTTALNADSLDQYQSELSSWKSSLDQDADILLYGCNVAQNEHGEWFIDQLSELTQADVAASTDLTGNTNRDGNWEFEYTVGSIEAKVAFSPALQNSFTENLAIVNLPAPVPDLINGNVNSIADLLLDDGGDGISLREAIVAADNDTAPDTITLGPGTYVLDLNGLSDAGDYDITTDITISGSGADQTTVHSALPLRIFDIYGNGNLTLNNLTVSGGSATIGGAVDVDSGSFLQASNVIFRDNSASFNGAALDTAGTTDLDKVSFIDNEAGKNGGAFTVTGGTTTLTNSTISGNTSDSTGGGITITSGTLIIDHTTIVNNQSVTGAGGGLNVSGGNVTISNSIVANNTDGDATNNDDVYGAVTSGGYNIVETTESALATTDTTNVDPGLQSLNIDHVSGLPHHTPQDSSFAIDGAIGSTLTDDFSGAIRSDGSPDIGSVERFPNDELLISTTVNVSNGSLPGLTAWNDDNVIRIDNPNLTLEYGDGSTGTTNGTFSEEITLHSHSISNGNDTDAIHLVKHAITLSGVNLKPGDLLFSNLSIFDYTNGDGTVVDLDPGNVHLFRPSTATFTPDIFTTATLGSGNIQGFTLVESETQVAGQTLSVGDILYIDTNANSVYVYSSSTSTSSVFLDGAGVGIVDDITGVALVESTQTIGGVTLGPGTLLLTVKSTEPAIGSNPVQAENVDIVAIELTSTGAGTTSGSASIVFDGSDIGLTILERFDALSLSGDNLEQNAITDLSSGIEINTDGDDAYLLANNGGAILGGRGSVTAEITFASTSTGGLPTLLSYAAPGTSAGNDFRIQLNTPTNGLSLFVNGAGYYSNGFDYDSLLDGQIHTITVTWDNTGGNWTIYADGTAVDSGTGLKPGEIITSGGTLLFGQEQDVNGGNFQQHETFSGTLYDVRIWDHIRTDLQIATNSLRKLDPGIAHTGLIANWQFDGFNASNEVVELVSANNLTIQHASDAGFTPNTPIDDLTIESHAESGTSIGFLVPGGVPAPLHPNKIIANNPSVIYSQATGKFYLPVGGDYSWTEASIAATSTLLNGVNGQLVTIQSQLENDLVQGFANSLPTPADVWIGTSDQILEGDWHWYKNGVQDDGALIYRGDATGSAQNGAYTNWKSSDGIFEPNATQDTEDYALLTSDSGEWRDTADYVNSSYVIEWGADKVLTNYQFLVTGQPGADAPLFSIDPVSGEVKLSTPKTPELFAGHVVHFDASVSGSISNAGGVQEILDLTGTGNDGHQSTISARPTVLTGSFNGRDSLHFDGVDDLIRLDDSSTINTFGIDIDKEQASVSIAFETSSDITTQQFLYEQGGDVSGISVYMEGGQLYAGAYSDSNGFTGNWVHTNLQPNTGYVATWTFNSTEGEMLLYLNGAYAGSAVVEGPIEHHTGDVALGAYDNISRVESGGISDTGSGAYFRGVISEFNYHNHALSHTDIAGLQAHLMNKWLATPLHPDHSVAVSHSIEIALANTAGTLYSETVPIAVTPGNSLTIAVPADQTIDEDSDLHFSEGKNTKITIADTDSGSDTFVQLSLSINDGVLKLAQPNTVTIVSGTDSSSNLTIESTEANVNAALNGMSFIPNPDFSGDALLQLETSFSTGIRGQYTFDGGSADDQSTTGNFNGTFEGGATTSPDAERGDVLSLNGSGQYVQIASTFNEPSDITLSAWVKRSNPGTLDEIISIGGDIGIRATPVSTVFFYRTPSGTNTLTASESLDNEWHHVAATFDDTNNTVTLYIDGVAVKTDTETQSIEYQQGNGALIGKNASIGSFDFGGLIDDVHIYSRALPADDLIALANDQNLETAAFAHTVSESVRIAVNPLNDTPTAINVGPSVAFVEGTTPVVLDNDITFRDIELDQADNYAGTTLYVGRAGGANPDDYFSNVGSLGPLVEGGIIEYANTNVGTVTKNNGGELVLLFNSEADHTVVNQIAQSIAYSNENDQPPGAVDLIWTFNDQNSGIQGAGGSKYVSVVTSVTIAQANDNPGNSGTLPTDITVIEDVLSPVDLSSVELSDPDAGNNLLTVSLSTTAGGELTLLPDANVTIGGTSIQRTLTGTLDALNNYLDNTANIQYRHPTHNLVGDNADYLRVIVSDNGNTGVGGGSNITLGVIDVDIAAINDAPALIKTAEESAAAYDFSQGTDSTTTGAPPLTVNAPVVISGADGFTTNKNGLLFPTGDETSATNLVSISSIPELTTNEFSFSAQVRFDAGDGDRKWERIFDFGSGAPLDNVTLGRRGVGGDLILAAYNGTTDIGNIRISGPLFGIEGEWHHYGVTIDASGLAQLYIDGQVVGSTNLTGLPNYSNWVENYLGSSNWENDKRFQGAMDDIALFNRALSGSEMAALANTTTSQDFTLPEHAVSGSSAGFVHGGDVDGDTLIYSIASQEHTGAFAIDPDTGEITVNDSAQLDFETDDAHDVTIRVSDGNRIDEEIYSVTLTDAAEPQLTAPTNQEIEEDDVLTFSSAHGNAVSVSDELAVGQALLRAQLSVNDGVLHLPGLSGITVVEGANESSSLTVVGTAADIEFALNGMEFRPDLNFHGNVELSITTKAANIDGLVGRYTFEDGNAIDHSPGLRQNGDSFTGNATTIIDPVRGEVLSLDGNGDSVLIPGLFGNPENVTLSAWVNLQNIAGNGAEIISLGNSVQLRADAQGAGNGISLAFRSAGIWKTIGTGDFIVGTGWNHVAATFDNDNNLQAVYLNGSLAQAEAHSTPIDYDQAANTLIGAHGDGLGTFDFNGYIDDVRIYSRALAEAEIAELASPTEAITTVATNLTTVSQTVPIQVHPVNDNPFNAGSLPSDVSVTEDVISNVDLSVFDFDDVDAGTANVTVRLSTAAGGLLTLAADPGLSFAGTAAAPTITGSLADLNAYFDNANNVQYRHGTDHTNGDNADTISVSIRDNGNTGAGGGAYVTLGTVNVDITPDNDEQVLATNAGTTVAEGSLGNVISSAMLQSTDIDHTPSQLVYSLDIMPVNGKLRLNGTTLSLNDSFTQADINAGAVTYDHDGSQASSDQFGFTVDDGVDAGSSGAFDIVVSNVNDAPVNTLPMIPLSVAEDTPITITGISVTDDDDNLSTVRLTVNDGTLNVSLSGGASIAAGANGSADLTIAGSLNDINDTLASVNYQGNLNFNGSDTLTIISTDTSSGTDSGTVSINVNSVNDEQVLASNAGTTVAEGSVGNVISSAILLATDVDHTASRLVYSLDTVPVNGTLRLNGLALTINDTFTQADINAGAVTYDHDGSQTSFDLFVFTVDDGADARSSDTFDIVVSNVNDAPVNTLPLIPLLVDEDTPISITGISIADEDDNLSNVRLSVNDGTFNVSLSGGASVAAGANGSADLTIAGSLNDINDTLASVTYQGNLHFNGSDTLTIISTDTSSGTDSDVLSINVNPVNDNPANAGTLPNVVTVTEDVLSEVDLSTVDFSDVDAGNDNVTLSLSTSTGGLLTLAADPGLSFTGTAAAPTITGSLADLNAYFDNANNVQYRHGTDHTNGDNADTIAVSIRDNGNTGAGGGAYVPLGTVDVDITPNNDEQTLTTNAGTTVAEGSVGNVISSAMLLTTDVDHTASQLVYSLDTVPENGTLRLNGLELTINDTFTQADINAGTVTYDHDGSQSSSDLFGFTVDDGADTGSSGTFDFVVSNVNDAPVNTVPMIPLSVDEDTPISITGISIADEDDNLSNVRLSVNDGTLSVSLSGGASVAAGANGSADLTIAGSLNDINDTLASVTYQGNLHFNGSDTLTIISTDTSSGTDSDVLSINVNPVNDNPANAGTLPNVVTVTEDVLSEVDLSSIDFSDVDAGNDYLTLSLSTSAGGQLILAADPDLSFSGTTSEQKITGNIAALNSYLDVSSNISYLHATANTNGMNADTITVTINDNGNTGTGGGTVQTLGTINITITPVNDEQLLTTNTGVTVAEGTTGNVISVALLEATDVDHLPDQLIYTIGAIPTHGTLNLNGTALSINDSFSQADINTGAVTYDHDGSQSSSDAFHFTVDDRVGDVLSSTFRITINNVNDAPVNTVPDPQLVDEDTPLSISGLEVSDDDDNLASVQLAVTSGTLSVTPSGNTVISAGVSGSSDLTLTGSLNDINATLNTLSYLGNSHFNGNDALTIVSTDNNGASVADTFTITVNPVNDQPVNTGVVPGSIAVEEDILSDLNLSSIDFSDVDAGSSNLTVTLSTTTGGEISLASDADLSFAGATNTRTITGTLTSLNNYFNTVGNIKYLHSTPHLNGVNSDSVTITINDNTGFGGGGTQLLGTVNIDITAVNDAPTLSGIEETPLSYVENRAVRVSESLVVDDRDSTDIHQATITISTNFNPKEDVLEFTSSPMIAGAFDTNTGELLLTGTASLAEYQQAIRSVTYRNASENPDTAVRQITITVSDGESFSNSASRTIDITPVNDPPTGSDHAVSFPEDGIYTLSADDFGFVDSHESDDFAGIEIVTPPATGALTLSGTAVTSGQFISSADFANGQLTFSPQPNDYGSPYDALVFRVVDTGSSGFGGTDSATEPNTLTFSVLSVNDAPTGQDTTVSFLEDTTHTFARADFGFSDLSDEDEFSAVTIETVPVEGILENNGAPILAGTVVDISEIDSGYLQYRPETNASGITVSGFTFRVHDSGEASNGGIPVSEYTNRIIFDLLGVNDPPSLTANEISVDEGQSAILSNDVLLIEDVDDTNPNDLVLMITSLPKHGALTLDGNAIDVGATFSPSALQQGLLRYTHDGSETSSDGFDLQVSDGGEDGSQPMSATLSLVINEVIDPAPVIHNETLTIPFGEVFDSENGSLLDTGNSTLAEQSIKDNPALLITLETAPQHGSLTINDKGGFLYIHGGGTALQDLFQYRVTNEDGEFSIGTVTITIEPPIASAIEIDSYDAQLPPELIDTTETVNPPDREPQHIEETAPQEEYLEEENTRFGEPRSLTRLSAEEVSEGVTLIDHNENPVQFAPIQDLLNDAYGVRQHNRQGEINLHNEQVIISNSSAVILEEIKVPGMRDIASNPLFSNALQQLDNDLREAENEDKRRYQLIENTNLGLSFSVTAGVFAWLLRGGALFASAIASTPLWSFIDPIRVMAAKSTDSGSQSKRGEKDNDELEKYFDVK